MLLEPLLLCLAYIVRLSVSNLLPTEDDGRIEICVEFTENITNAGSVMVTSNNELATGTNIVLF